MQDYHINVFYSKDDGGCIEDIPDLEFCGPKTPGLPPPVNRAGLSPAPLLLFCAAWAPARLGRLLVYWMQGKTVEHTTAGNHD